MKHLILFEQFVEEALTPGQKRAVSAGKDLLNIGQAAVAYIMAYENEISRNQNSNLAKEFSKKYGNINTLMSEVFGAQWKNMDFNKWKKEVLPGVINMEKHGSLVRATEKMKKMINGDFEKGGNETIYDLIKGYFDTINKMSKDELVDFVNEFIKDPKAEKYQAGYEEVK